MKSTDRSRRRFPREKPASGQQVSDSRGGAGRPPRHLLLPFRRVLLPPFSTLQASSLCILSSCYQILALVVPLQYITIFVRVFSPSTQLSPVAERPTGRLLQLVKHFYFIFYIHPQFVSQVFIFELLRCFFFSPLGYICSVFVVNRGTMRTCPC